ncbi:MAG: nitroreductase [Anaerocolumna sp.]|jgi:nitroreductase|nr:nitroreductase [Anaerocolumna sp.]
MQDIITTIKQRRSIRKFKEDQLPKESLLTILEAGQYAPSGGNNQSTHMIVIQNKEILKKLKAIVEHEFSQMEIHDDMYESIKSSIRASKKGGYEFFYKAPSLIIVANKKGYGNAMADSTCVLENMMLAATGLEVGTCWINQLHWLEDNESIRVFLKELGLSEDETICGGLALGYADVTPINPVKRIGNPITFID